MSRMSLGRKNIGKLLANVIGQILPIMQVEEIPRHRGCVLFKRGARADRFSAADAHTQASDHYDVGSWSILNKAQT